LLAFALGAVLGTGLLAIGDALGIEHTADDVVAHPRQVADASAADEHDGVLLKVVSLAGDVGGDLDAVGQAAAGHLAQGGVGLLGRHDFDLQADALLLRAAVQGWVFGPAILLHARLADELVDSRHNRFAASWIVRARRRHSARRRSATSPHGRVR